MSPTRNLDSQRANDKRGYTSSDREQIESTTNVPGFNIPNYLNNSPQQNLTTPVSLNNLSRYQDR